MDICNLCGTALINGSCPHCGQRKQHQASLNVYQCLSKAAECLKKKQWRDAESFVLKGYEQDPSNKDLPAAELLALTELLQKIPASPTAEARVRDLLEDLGKSVRFRYVVYDLEPYRRLLRSHDLANTPLPWWAQLIFWILVPGLIFALFALANWILTAPVIGGIVVLVALWFIFVR